jgi:Flp pilus assembly pilin Flp
LAAPCLLPTLLMESRSAKQCERFSGWIRKGVNTHMLIRLYARAQAAWAGLRAHLENEDGIVATEYIIMLGLVALAIVAGATALGLAINDKLTSTAGKVGALP